MSSRLKLSGMDFTYFFNILIIKLGVSAMSLIIGSGKSIKIMFHYDHMFS